MAEIDNAVLSGFPLRPTSVAERLAVLAPTVLFMERTGSNPDFSICLFCKDTLCQAHKHPQATSLCSQRQIQEGARITGPVYRIACGGDSDNSCSEVYIGETERTLRARFMEHRRPSSTTSEVSKHIHIQWHWTTSPYWIASPSGSNAESRRRSTYLWSPPPWTETGAATNSLTSGTDYWPVTWGKPPCPLVANNSNLSVAVNKASGEVESSGMLSFHSVWR